MMRTALIAGNWKMHNTVSEALTLVDGVLGRITLSDDREVLVCPPFTALHAVGERLRGSGLMLGAQDVHHEAKGAYTGAIAPGMLRDVGCRYVIVGHSERRQIFGEDDAAINRKVRAVLAADMRPILCVGETIAQREAGDAASVVVGQVRDGLAGIAATDALVIAYEPVWAIGTGVTATPSDAQQMHATIRAILAEWGASGAAARIRILYGGSVKPDTIDELMACPDVDGALVGGASLQPEGFARIVQYR
jgi:triosephosphate isomerase